MIQTELVLWAALAIGLIFGVTGQITGFCLHRGLSEFWSGRTGYKLHAFAIALAVALAGTHLIASMNLVNLNQSLYLMPSYSWFLLPLGGLLFGYGMSLANGCGARALVLLAQGNLRSFVVLLCLGIAAYMTLTGVLAPLRIYLNQLTSFTPTAVTISEGLLRTIIIGSLVVLLLWFALVSKASGQRAKDLISGVIVGILIIAGWLTTGWLGDDPFEPIPVTSLSFVAPIGDTIQYAMLSTGINLKFSIALVFGVLLGSFFSALIRRNYQLSSFESPKQMARYIVGGLLMGVGGVLAFGCTIGQGLTGLSTLAFSSVIAAITIIIGARIGFKATTA